MTYHCSFCAKSQHEVSKLIAGPDTTFICNDCVSLCQDIINDRTYGPRVGTLADIGVREETMYTSVWDKFRPQLGGMFAYKAPEYDLLDKLNDFQSLGPLMQLAVVRQAFSEIKTLREDLSIKQKATDAEWAARWSKKP